MRRALMVTALAVALSAPIASASANTTVTVPGLAFPSDDTYLTYFGCDDLYHADTRAPQVADRPRVRPGRHPQLRPPHARHRHRIGPRPRHDSIADTTVASFAARPRSGGDGVAYVWYVTPELRPGQVWAGRADLTLAPGWQTVDTTASSYTWQLVTAATGAVVRDGGTSTIADFTDENGDGPGYLLAGFGCDGAEFSIDRLRYGSPGNVTTYDLEGIAATAQMRKPSEAKVAAGDPVTITGQAVDGTVPRSARRWCSRPSPPAPPTPRSRRSATPSPSRTTAWSARWSTRGSRPSTAGTSPPWDTPTRPGRPPMTVTVEGDEPAPPAEPGEEPTGTPSTGPSDSSGGDTSTDEVEVPALPTPAPSDDSTDGPTDEPSDEPTTEPSDAPSEQPTEAPSDQPSDASTDAPADALSLPPDPLTV